MPKPKVLIVCQHFWPENFRINDICNFLVEDKGCDVEVLCGLPNYPSGNFPKGYGYFKNLKQVHKGAVIHRALEIPRGNNSNFRIFLNYISFPIASLFFIPILLFKRYDKIFLYQLSPVFMTISGILLGKLTRTETTMYVLDLWPENLYSVLNIQNKVLRKIASGLSHWHYQNVDKIIVLSEAMRDRIIEVSNVKRRNVIVLPQAAEKIYEKEVYNQDLASRFGSGFNILFTGSLTPAQSFNTIIEAAKILQGKGINDINWIIVGDGMSREQIRLDVHKAGLEDRFFFEGQKPIEDIPRYTTIADGLIGCLVKSDLLEATIPAKVMSYVASGKPLLLAMDGEVQVLVNKIIRGGYVSNTEDPISLAKNINKLRNLTTSERLAMSQRLKQYHFENFERNIILNKLYSFLFSKETTL